MTLRSHWCLNPDIDFLNHGSFGATPLVVLAEQSRLREQLERDPIEFLAPERELEPKLDQVRIVLSELVHAEPIDLAFVRNATDGVNAVVGSFPFERGDEVVITNHGYNACNNAVRYAAARAGAETVVAQIPFPIESGDQVIDALVQVLTGRTRLLLVDHVTSPTGLVFPVERIVELAHRRGIRVMIDGAHAPGMVSVNLRAINADYYTANHHKWLCAPKASGFLYVRPEFQDEVRPTIISHAYNRPRPGRSKFLAEFDWIGTYDPTPLLALPSAIAFLEGLREGGLTAHVRANRELALDSQSILCDALRIERPCPNEMIGSLVSVPLAGMNPEAGQRLGRALFQEERIEVPIFRGVVGPPQEDEDTCYLRVSLQAYNDRNQIERLAWVLRQRLDR